MFMRGSGVCVCMCLFIKNYSLCFMVRLNNFYIHVFHLLKFTVKSGRPRLPLEIEPGTT